MMESTLIVLLFVIAVGSASSPLRLLFPWHPHNPHLQDYIRTQLEAYHPRNEYHLRRFYQDAETRCRLRLWRISRRGLLACSEDEDCDGSQQFFCRTFQVCKETEGGVCWPQSEEGGACDQNSGCTTDKCDETVGVCESSSNQTMTQHYHSTATRIS